ncbi:MAG: FAD-binding oxidoreductase [Alphaproteobacteria bacterium]|nr:FAD-binding oxidoreductase [Alphaproteobacteria bacterium]
MTTQQEKQEKQNQQEQKVLPEQFVTQIASIVGEDGYSISQDDISPFLNDASFAYAGNSPLLVQPAFSEETSKIVKLCHENNIGIVPVGGRTGLVGGGVPFGQILISTARMNKIIEIDAENYTMIVEAGCTLADARIAADENGCMLSLSMPSEKDSQIGGNIATNMGGVNFLHYGGARESLLGLEVVMPDGRIWNGLRKLEKDNTGYDLKQLFVGSEGTLGIITGVVLKLRPKPLDVQVAIVAFNDLACVLPMFASAKNKSGDNVTAFELIPRQGLEYVLASSDESKDPMDKVYDWYVLVELSSSNPVPTLRQSLKNIIEDALNENLVLDSVVAENADEAAVLWKIRNTLPGTIYQKGGATVFDISVPVSKVPEFISKATDIVRRKIPAAYIVPFGHVGDGNIHFSINNVQEAPSDENKRAVVEIISLIHQLVIDMGGAISAEHGIGCFKKSDLEQYSSDVEIDIMRKIKGAIDPKNIMNPGKVIDI